MAFGLNHNEQLLSVNSSWNLKKIQGYYWAYVASVTRKSF